MKMIKEALMNQVANQLGEYAEKGFKNLQDKINRVNQQNDELIDLINQMIKAQITLWKALKNVHYSDRLIFDKAEADMGIKMEVEQ